MDDRFCAENVQFAELKVSDHEYTDLIEVAWSLGVDDASCKVPAGRGGGQLKKLRFAEKGRIERGGGCRESRAELEPTEYGVRTQLEREELLYAGVRQSPQK